MRFDKYKPILSWPQKEQYTTYKIVTLYDARENLTREEYKKCKEGLIKNKVKFLEEKVVSEAYYEKINEYHEESWRLDEQFKQDLKSEVGDFGNEGIFNLLYNKAYQDGHACGYSEVYSCYSDLYDFVKEILAYIE